MRPRDPQSGSRRLRRRPGDLLVSHLPAGHLSPGTGALGQCRKGRLKVRQTSDVVTPGPWGDDPNSSTMTWLAKLLTDEGVNLIHVTAEQLKRGTPVYVESSADVVEVQRLMARHHIRMLPVLANGA